MSAPNGVIWNVWLVSALLALPASVAYLVWVRATRDSVRTRARSLEAGARVEARWGMALAIPPALLLLAGATSAGVPIAVAMLLGLAVAAFYCIPLAVVMGRDIPTFARWVPSAVALPITLLIVLLSVPIMASAGSLGFIVLAIAIPRGWASCLVAIRFAQAVRALERERCGYVPAPPAHELRAAA